MGQQNETGRYKTFTRRAAMLAGGQIALLSVLVGRMYYLQVVQSEQYLMLAEDNRINLQLLPPSRGRILDRFGVELATNRQNFRVLLVPEQTEDVEQTLAALGQFIDLPDHLRRRVKREVGRRRAFLPVTVAENLAWEDFARVNVHSPELPGIQPDVGETRTYPIGAPLAHVIGYVGAVSEKEINDDPVYQLPGFRIGKNGIEKGLEPELRGRAGNSRVEVNAYGRMIRELARTDGTAGDDVVLTIDMDLQQFATTRLGEESASAVVMDVATGDILAMASTPAFEPNAFNIGLSRDEWHALRTNPKAPLVNKPIAGQYPPGSTFKMVVGLAALHTGAIQPSHAVTCRGSVKLGSHEFHCWKRGGHGTVNFVQALEQSCDCYFYDIAKRTGIDRLAEISRLFGFGAPCRIEIPGERGGIMPDQAWKQQALGKSWQQGETLICGIGQGYVLATPLQLAVMTARLAAGGRAVQPRLVRSVGAQDREPHGPAPSLGIDERFIALALEGMNRVINGAAGTARHVRKADDTFLMAGKTGTAQVRRISRAERQTRVRRDDEKPWEERDHSLYVGYAPYDSPRYAIAVMVEHGGGGSKVAAPMAADILREAMRLDPLGRAALGPIANRDATTAPDNPT
ncbi:penicillin-binding protein 2 [Zavarzinia sp. CC-PAN008]|uniref:penicillin-binding protein 2 n=1 Tax=Zavarzinia sp. CC-PAN008 TaxID=3243332 RepID=UPI003F743290